MCRVTGLPRATIYEMVSKRKFPNRLGLSCRALFGWIEFLEILDPQTAGAPPSATDMENLKNEPKERLELCRRGGGR